MCKNCNKLNEKQVLNTHKVMNTQEGIIIAIRTGKGLKIGGSKND